MVTHLGVTNYILASCSTLLSSMNSANHPLLVIIFYKNLRVGAPKGALTRRYWMPLVQNRLSPECDIDQRRPQRRVGPECQLGARITLPQIYR